VGREEERKKERMNERKDGKNETSENVGAKVRKATYGRPFKTENKWDSPKFLHILLTVSHLVGH